MDSDLIYMNHEEIKQSLQTRQLELRYEQALRLGDRIYEEERVRALKVEILLLQDDNDDCHSQIIGLETERIRLQATNEVWEQELEKADDDLEQAFLDLKTKNREIENSKAEIAALNAANGDAMKMLSEKLSLARELATVKTELDHLRSQSSTQQNLLAEKLALQRELSSLQVELETEKRTVQRIKAQDKSVATDKSALNGEVEELKKEVAKAQREAQKHERENRKKAIDWENQKEVLEGKLEAFRNKLRSTKEQLKEAQEDVERAQAAKMVQSAEMTKARLTGANPKKRTIARFDPDMTIGTPGHGRPAAKKSRTSVNVGDKSTFSITPFLSRTMSILPESPSEEDKEAHERADEIINEQLNSIANEAGKVVASSTANKTILNPWNTTVVTAVKTKTKQPLKETTNPKANAIVKQNSLPKVAEEADDDAQEKSEDRENANPTGDETNATALEPVKKKQKVLNKRTNIFDEEDSANSGAPKIRPLTATTLRGGGITTSSLGKINLTGLGKGGKGKMLAEFSPLKKDRRAAVSTVS